MSIDPWVDRYTRIHFKPFRSFILILCVVALDRPTADWLIPRHRARTVVAKPLGTIFARLCPTYSTFGTRGGEFFLFRCLSRARQNQTGALPSGSHQSPPPPTLPPLLFARDAPSIIYLLMMGTSFLTERCVHHFLDACFPQVVSKYLKRMTTKQRISLADAMCVRPWLRSTVLYSSISWGYCCRFQINNAWNLLVLSLNTVIFGVLITFPAQPYTSRVNRNMVRAEGEDIAALS